MAVPTWKLAESKMSVRVNGVFLPFKEAPSAMHRYVRPALFRTGDAIFELQFAGTAIMAKLRGWHFALLTDHQTADKNLASEDGAFVVVIEREGRRFAIPPRSAFNVRYASEGSRSLEDLRIFDYEDGHPELRAHHLDLDAVIWSDRSDMEVDYSFLIGFPSKSVKIELEDGEALEVKDFKVQWVRQDLEQVEPKPMDTEHRLVFAKHRQSTRDSIDPDGLSGSPVFSIVKDNRSARHLRFEGIITNANGDRFGVYPSDRIRDSLEDILRRKILNEL